MLKGELLGQVVAVLVRARIGAGNLEHDAAVLLQQFAEPPVVIRGHGGPGLHPSSCSLRRLCPSGTWFAGRSGLSPGAAPPGHRYSITFDPAVASPSGCPTRPPGPTLALATTAPPLIATSHY